MSSINTPDQAGVSFSSLETQREIRIKKMEQLRHLGHDPYKPNAKRDFTLEEVKVNFEEHSKLFDVTLCGRIKSKRASGKIAFATIEDESCTEGFQFIFKKDLLPANTNTEGLLTFDHFTDLIDEGDYIQATGTLEKSQRGEPSLFVRDFTILTKALQPTPQKFEDKEARFRQRYVDMRVNSEVRSLLSMKSRFWSATKEFMDDHSFKQVFMPVMQETTGGAEANPFVTHHNALNEDFYLGISPELHLKRMIVGGFEKIYDIGKNFRNEGIDDEHLQEFLRIEFYWAYANHQELMNFTEELMKHAIKEAFGTLNLVYKKRDENGQFTGEEVLVDWSQPWKRMSYYDFIEHFGRVDLRQYTELHELQQVARNFDIHFDHTDGFGRLTDLIYKKIARPKCIQPVWMTDIPTRLSPLAKRDPENPELTLRSHLLAYGSELTNGFAELNDPIDQLERFKEQQAARDAGDEEAMMIDLDFVNALEIGLPPTVGFAYSDRLFDLLANKTMREATAFPLMKRKSDSSNPGKVVLCGSTKHYDTMLEVQKDLEQRGYKVYLPMIYEITVDYDSLDDKKASRAKSEFLQKHLEKIKSSDAILVVNEPTNGIKDYIGSETLIEMGYAFGIKKKIFIYNDIPEQNNRIEILGMEPVILGRDLGKLQV